jgi:general L-amino acid transport system substrate-binding protein
MLMRGALTCVCLALAAPALASTLDAVRTAGTLVCGVVNEPEDWTKTDLHGGLAPLGIEVCKAVAVAALGSAAKVAIKPYASELEAGAGLQKGEVALALGMTPTATGMWQFRIGFGPPVFYDGQSILVRADAHVAKPADLAGLRVCFIDATDNDTVLLSHTVARNIAIIPMPFQEEGEMDDALSVRHCDAVSAYVSRLARLRAAYPQLAHDVILDDWLTLAPVAPAYRQDDRQWGMIVDWTINALVQAEESGVTQANVGEMRGSTDPVVQRLLGTDWAASHALGLQDHFWAATVISVVGNYGEIYDRTLGAHGALHLPRGRNALWTQGGLLHPLPVQ